MNFFSENLTGRKYSTQIAISIKGSKIREEAKQQDLISLNKYFAALFYIHNIMQGTTNIFLG